MQPALDVHFALGPATELAAAPLGPAAGSLTVDAPGDPLDGVRLDVPSGALAFVTRISISSQPIAAGDFGPLLHPATPLITVSGFEGYVDELLTLRIPVSIPDGSLAAAFFYDGGTGRLEMLPVTAEDATGLTVATRHFSSIFVSVISLGALPDRVDSGFRPRTDDWQFPNMGSYITPGGECSGQSVTEMWYFIEQVRAAGAPPLYGLYDDNTGPKTPALWQDDAWGYRLASTVQEDTNFKSWGATLFINSEQSPDWLRRDLLRYAIAVTGEPQELGLYDRNGDHGHAIVAYFVMRDFVFVADPNYPGQIRVIPWDVDTGHLGPYDSAEVAGGPGISYVQILFEAKSALVDWDLLGRRWAEFRAGTIGNDSFPAYRLLVVPDEPNGDPGREAAVPLTDGYTTDRPGVTILVPVDGVAHARGGIYRGERLVSQRTQPAVTLDLGANNLGILIEAKPANGDYEWVDFVRLTINRAAPASPTPGPRWVTAQVDAKVTISKDPADSCVATIYLAFMLGDGPSSAQLSSRCKPPHYDFMPIDASGTFDGHTFALKASGGEATWTGELQGDTVTLTGGLFGQTLTFPIPAN